MTKSGYGVDVHCLWKQPRREVEKKRHDIDRFDDVHRPFGESSNQECENDVIKPPVAEPQVQETIPDHQHPNGKNNCLRPTTVVRRKLDHGQTRLAKDPIHTSSVVSDVVRRLEDNVEQSSWNHSEFKKQVGPERFRAVERRSVSESIQPCQDVTPFAVSHFAVSYIAVSRFLGI